VSFEQRFGVPSGSLWAIDVDHSAELSDRLVGAATVLLNLDVMNRDFADEYGSASPALIPDSYVAGIQVDLIRSLIESLHGQLADEEEGTEYEPGSVGSLLVGRLKEAFGSVGGALASRVEDPASFSRSLWDRFAPNSWRTR
jgi:hypothetical protein